MLDMDSSDSFTLGFPLLLFPLAAPERSQAFRHTEMLLYTHEFDPRLTSQNHFFLFLVGGWGGVFFFLHHYLGNLIHTEYKGEERGRLDRGLEEIMKFVHIQANWKVPPPPPPPPRLFPNCPPPPQSSFSPQTARFPTPTTQKKIKRTLLIALGEAEWGRTWRWSASNLCQSVESGGGERMISIFSLAPGLTVF